MPAPKGHPRYGGRARGTPNRRTAEIRERIDRSGRDPVQTLIELLDHDEPGIKLQAARTLMEYYAPRLKPVQLEISDLPDDVFQEEAERRLKALNGGKKDDAP